MIDPLVVEFPGLATSGYRVTSEATDRYNCIAWAASRSDRWWWPHPDAFWPVGVPMQLTLDAFVAVYGTLGYASCTTDSLEVRFEKIAIFTNARNPYPCRASVGEWAMD